MFASFVCSLEVTTGTQHVWNHSWNRLNKNVSARRNLPLKRWKTLDTFVSFNQLIQEVLTPQKCASHVIVRGLVRVRCVQELDQVLRFMTRKGLINTGVLAVKQPLLPEKYRSVSVDSCHFSPPFFLELQLLCLTLFSTQFSHYANWFPPLLATAVLLYWLTCQWEAHTVRK